MGDLLHQFGINGQLLLAQVVNFALLVLVLRAFVWKPVLRVLHERRERIQAAELGAATLSERNRAAEEELSAKRAEAGAEASRIIAKAKQRAEEEAAGVRAAATAEAAQIRAAAELALAKEREAMHAEVRSRVIGLTVAATSKLLAEEVSPERAAQAVDASLADLER